MSKVESIRVFPQKFCILVLLGIAGTLVVQSVFNSKRQIECKIDDISVTIQDKTEWVFVPKLYNTSTETTTDAVF